MVLTLSQTETVAAVYHPRLYALDYSLLRYFLKAAAIAGLLSVRLFLYSLTLQWVTRR